MAGQTRKGVKNPGEPARSACVLQVIPQLDAGGAERTTVEVAEALVAAGVRALVASEGGRLAEEIVGLGENAQLITMPVASKNPATMIANARALAHLIREEAVDIVHARSRAPAWSALWAARNTGAAFVTTYHGAYGGSSALKRYYNGVMARGDRVIANSEFIAEHVRERYGLDGDRLRVIPRGVNLAAFDRDAVDSQRLDEVFSQWRIARDDPRMLLVLPGRLTRWKGQTVAIEALAQLHHEGVDAQLVLVGDAQGRDDYRRELNALAASYKLADFVRMPGHCSDMPAAFAAADVILAPSTSPEAFGRVAAEAQCMGRLVVASDHGGQRETVDPQIGGALVTPGDSRQLAKAVSSIAGLDNAERGQQEMAVLERARALYSTKALQRATLSVYEECLTMREHG